MQLETDHIPPKMYELIASVRVISPCSCLAHTAIAASPSPYNHIQRHDHSLSHFLTSKYTISDNKNSINGNSYQGQVVRKPGLKGFLRYSFLLHNIVFPY